MYFLDFLSNYPLYFNTFLQQSIQININGRIRIHTIRGKVTCHEYCRLTCSHASIRDVVPLCCCALIFAPLVISNSAMSSYPIDINTYFYVKNYKHTSIISYRYKYIFFYVKNYKHTSIIPYIYKYIFCMLRFINTQALYPKDFNISLV